jgi:VanZ family protein
MLISVFSTQYFAAEQTGGVILPVLHWLFPWATRRMLHLLHSGIRKAAHVTEFGIFSITVFRGVRAGRSGWKFNWAVTTLVIAVLYAALDEWHQSFVLLRHATPRDVAIDAIWRSAGSMFCLGAWHSKRAFHGLSSRECRFSNEAGGNESLSYSACNYGTLADTSLE